MRGAGFLLGGSLVGGLFGVDLTWGNYGGNCPGWVSRSPCRIISHYMYQLWFGPVWAHALVHRHAHSCEWLLYE